MNPPRPSRRELLTLGAAGVAGASLSGWLAPLAAHAAAPPARRHRSCILLWMDGGPSHVDTFDPKPDALGLSALVRDLKERGLLETTLVIWMGEFGRTPNINRVGGRDHYARAWSTLLVGGGIRGGQVIGKTDREGAAVVERPIAARDFLATVCRILGIDGTKQIQTPTGRPVRIIESGEKVITEVLA
jgi:uncharacterized protein (DUF1501 family)